MLSYVDSLINRMFKKCSKETNSLFFIDLGYIMEMACESDLEMFKLSENAQQMTSRAIPCKVVQVQKLNK